MDDSAGKLKWFMDVIMPCRGTLHARVRRIVPAHVDADDIVAETLARTYAVDDWHDIGNGLAFMQRIARNLLIDHARREAVVSFDYMADLEEFGRSVDYDGMFNARDELRRLEKLVQALPTQQRRAFILRRVEGHSIAHVAETMGLSVSTVENHLCRALAAIARGSLARGSLDSDDYGVERSASRQGAAPSHRGRGRASGRTV